MAETPDSFEDPGLAAAIKQTTEVGNASPELRARVAGLLRASAPVLPLTDAARPKRPAWPPRDGGRVFGLPRVWGLAAAVAMLISGAALISYELREFFPAKVRFDPIKAVIASLVDVHRKTPDDAKLFADLGTFQQSLPASMPVAVLTASGATFRDARVDAVDGQMCYAVRYFIDGTPVTLVTSAVKDGYAVPAYNQVQEHVRLVGGDRGGYLVCVMGDSKIPGSTYKALLDGTKLLESPSTQPVSALSTHGACLP